MSFSKRYAKHHTNESGVKASQEEDVFSSVLPPFVHDSEPEPEPEPEPELPKKRVPRFVNREPESAIPSFKPRKPGLQASRLNSSYQTQSHHEVNNASSWKSIFGLLVFVVCLLMIGMSWHLRDRWFFPIQHIALTGDFNKVDSSALEQLLHQDVKGSLLFLSTTKLKHDLEQLPWVDQVNIRRVWPSTLQIGILQNQPVARFGDHQLLNQTGTLFTPSNMQGMEYLPYINGPEDRALQLWQAYLALGEVLAPYDLKILRLEVTPRLAYTLVLNNGITLYLGANDILNRLTIFTKVYAKNLHDRAQQIEYADMRYNSGMAVGWKNQNPSPASS